MVGIFKMAQPAFGSVMMKSKIKYIWHKGQLYAMCARRTAQGFKPKLTEVAVWRLDRLPDAKGQARLAGTEPNCVLEGTNIPPHTVVEKFFEQLGKRKLTRR